MTLESMISYHQLIQVTHSNHGMICQWTLMSPATMIKMLNQKHREIIDINNHKRYHRDGSISTTFKDGSVVTRYPTGVVILNRYEHGSNVPKSSEMIYMPRLNDAIRNRDRCEHMASLFNKIHDMTEAITEVHISHDTRDTELRFLSSTNSLYGIRLPTSYELMLMENMSMRELDRCGDEVDMDSVIRMCRDKYDMEWWD